MSEEPTPPRPSLATLLRGAAPRPAAAGPDVPEQEAVPMDADMQDRSGTPEAGHDAASAHDGQDDPPAGGAAAPSFLRPSSMATTAARRTPRWQWLLLAALALSLAVQVVVADRASLAASAGWRPFVTGLCAALRCTVPPWHQPDAFTMLQRDVRPAPGRAGVLQVQASFRNDARWAQAWPALRLSLSDADGRVIGRRLLQPGDYLGPGQAPRQPLEPGQSAQVSFLLREPSAATVAYTFEFR